jgi:glucose/arabinose dehydrogenase
VVESGDESTWAPAGATFIRAPTFPGWQGSLIVAALRGLGVGPRGTTLWRLSPPPESGPRLNPRLEPLLRNDPNRLRTTVERPDGMLYLLTSNRDGRGRPSPEDDRILRLVPT